MSAKELIDQYGRTGKQFLEDMFECEYCDECGGDIQDHDPIPLNLGYYSGYKINWFARCKTPTVDDHVELVPWYQDFRSKRWILRGQVIDIKRFTHNGENIRYAIVKLDSDFKGYETEDNPVSRNISGHKWRLVKKG